MAQGMMVMVAKLVVPGLWEISLGVVNSFLLDNDDGLALIDTGVPGSAPKILEAIREIGRQPADLRSILVTHCHVDHAGSLAELKRITGATATMHPLDAAMVRQGQAARPLTPTPGIVNALICRFLIGNAPKEVEPAEVEHEANDGDILPGGLKAIHVPGHCLGQIALLWDRGVLFAADSAANVFGLALSPLHEDLAEGKRSLAKLSGFDFDVAVFGHGKPILSGASAKFRKTWPAVRQMAQR